MRIAFFLPVPTSGSLRRANDRSAKGLQACNQIFLRVHVGFAVWVRVTHRVWSRVHVGSEPYEQEIDARVRRCHHFVPF